MEEYGQSQRTFKYPLAGEGNEKVSGLSAARHAMLDMLGRYKFLGPHRFVLSCKQHAQAAHRCLNEHILHSFHLDVPGVLNACRGMHA